MKYTKNLNLKKPEQTDFYNVDDSNENFDALDEVFYNLKKSIKSANLLNNRRSEYISGLGSNAKVYFFTEGIEFESGVHFFIPEEYTNTLCFMDSEKNTTITSYSDDFKVNGLYAVFYDGTVITNVLKLTDLSKDSELQELVDEINSKLAFEAQHIQLDSSADINNLSAGCYRLVAGIENAPFNGTGILVQFNKGVVPFQIAMHDMGMGSFYFRNYAGGWSEWHKSISYGTEDLTAGTSPLATGNLYVVYE